MIRFVFFTVWAVCTICGHAQAEERRLALIIANEEYPASIGRLTNTHEDAATVETALRSAGFAVTKVLDADTVAMNDALTQFELAINAEAADGDDVVAFFYGSMHGAAAEVDGRTRNFLLPAKEEIASTGQLIRKGVRMDQMISGFASTNAKAVLIVSDACRNNMATSFSKSTTKGFIAEASRPGILVAYATSPGATTPDDGLFARVLAEELVKPGRKASFAMLAAIESVAAQRSFEGQPFLSSGGLPDWLCFGGCEIDDLPLGGDTDEQDWARFSGLDTVFGYRAYLSFHPNGLYVDVASRRLKELQASESAPEKIESDEVETSPLLITSTINSQLGFVKSDTAALKIEPDIDSESILFLERWDWVNILDSSASLGWFRVEYRGEIGYLQAWQIESK